MISSARLTPLVKAAKAALEENIDHENGASDGVRVFHGDESSSPSRAQVTKNGNPTNQFDNEPAETKSSVKQRKTTQKAVSKIKKESIDSESDSNVKTMKQSRETGKRKVKQEAQELPIRRSKKVKIFKEEETTDSNPEDQSMKPKTSKSQRSIKEESQDFEPSPRRDSQVSNEGGIGEEEPPVKVRKNEKIMAQSKDKQKPKVSTEWLSYGHRSNVNT